MAPLANRPSERLVGLTLEGGWKVVAKAVRSSEATGASNSTGYFVERVDGARGFLKAIDLTAALSASNPMFEMGEISRNFNFECELCGLCTKYALDHVVVALVNGSITVDPGDLSSVVPYIIFERADRDVRHHLASAQGLEHAWILRCLHHVAVGLQQLHEIDVAHQDVKPSNVLVFEDMKSKIADLGNSARKGFSSPSDLHSVPGTPAYSPPECLYGYQPSEWNERRLGNDLYTFGGMIVYLFTKTTINALLFDGVAEHQKPLKWDGKYDEVLPFLLHAFGQALIRVGGSFPEAYREELLAMVSYLCNPDPVRRGHPEEFAPALNRQSLRRFVSKLNEMASKAESQV